MSWAAYNIAQDDNDDFETYSRLLDHLKSYISPERYSEEVKFREMEKEKQEESIDLYEEMLLKQGASVKEVK